MGTAGSVVVAVVIAAGAGASRPAGALPAEDARPSAAFRLHHRAFRADLAHLDDLVKRIPAQEESRRRTTMAEVVAYLDAHLAAHARAEDEVLYPAVDERAGGTEPFTAPLRREHRIIERWIAELDRVARLERPDPPVFARQANRLLGLVEAHFEVEEEVLLPILDRTMTAREFQEEVGDRMGPLHEKLPPLPAGPPAPHRRAPGAAPPPPGPPARTPGSPAPPPASP